MINMAVINEARANSFSKNNGIINRRTKIRIEKSIDSKSLCLLDRASS